MRQLLLLTLCLAPILAADFSLTRYCKSIGNHLHNYCTEPQKTKSVAKKSYLKRSCLVTQKVKPQKTITQKTIPPKDPYPISLMP
jgi:hypothetical protein